MALHTHHFKVAFPDELKQHEGSELNVQHTLFNFLVRGMQFTYDRVGYRTQKRYLLPNGTWMGDIGYVNRSEVDILWKPFEVKEWLNEVAYISFPYDYGETAFVTRKPEYSPETMALFRTLSLSVWLSLLATTILFALVCFAWLKHRYTLEEIFFHVLAVGLNQEGDVLPRRAGGSLLLGTWMIGMALFTFCFKSVLLSFLACPPLQGIRTAPELAAAIREGKYSAYRLKQDDDKVYLANSSNGNIRTIGESVLKSPAHNYDGSTGKIMEDFGLFPNKAFVQYRKYVSFMEEFAFISEDNLNIYFIAIPTKKDFCCKDEMNMLIHRFAAAGFKQKIDRFAKTLLTLYYFSSKNPDDDEKIRKIAIIDLSGAFILLVAGHCLSVFALIIELGMKRRAKSPSSTRKK